MYADGMVRNCMFANVPGNAGKDLLLLLQINVDCMHGEALSYRAIISEMPGGKDHKQGLPTLRGQPVNPAHELTFTNVR